jgi:hypothetical protein
MTGKLDVLILQIAVHESLRYDVGGLMTSEVHLVQRLEGDCSCPAPGFHP